MEEDEYFPDQWYWVDKHLSEPVTMDEYPWLGYSSTVGQNAVFSPNGTFIRALSTSHHQLFCEIDAFEDRLGPFLCKSFIGGPVPVYRPTTRSCYYPFEGVETFTSARSRCETSGTHLMHADTHQELELLFDKLQVGNGSSNFWLGLKREADGSWNWISSKAPIPVNSPVVTDFCEITLCPEMDLAYALQDGAELVQIDSTHQSQTLCEEELSEAFVVQSLCTRHHGISTAILDFDGRRCYYVLNNQMTLDSATTACDDEETHLPHIDNILEELWLRAELQARFLSTEVWLGLKRTSTTEWSWFTPSWNILANTLAFSSHDTEGPGFATLAATSGWMQTDPARVQPVVCEQKLDISVVTVQTPTTTIDPLEGPAVYSDFKRYSGSEAFEWIQTRNVTSRLDCARKCNMLTNCVMFKVLAENTSMTCSMMALSSTGSVSDCSSPTRCYRKHSSELL
ncbi:uncharacterized protein LOC124262513 [Haliotis rubra]|uniref:uncharacterized protein LOC124262513 n=1 Tax=Haliotis rubra TaxID=36100 RepID=UPI001EE59591|nr:uncharacterized protein LOC124262513 [Haliotis rubra]